MSSPTPISTPVPEPASTGTPIVSDAMRLVRVLISPGAVFAEIEKRPTFWGPWLVVAIINIVLNYLQAPFQQRIGQIMTERAGRPFTEPTAVRTIVGSVLSGAVGPLLLCAIVGGVLYVLVSMFGGTTSYKKMMAVSIFTWPVTLIQLAVTWVVLNSRGAGSISGPQDMIVSLGADLLVPTDAQIGYFARFLLAGIGPLPIWKLTITAVGLMVMGKCGKSQGWTAATIIYVLTIVVVAGIGAFGMKMMGG